MVVTERVAPVVLGVSVPEGEPAERVGAEGPAEAAWVVAVTGVD